MDELDEHRSSLLERKPDAESSSVADKDIPRLTGLATSYECSRRGFIKMGTSLYTRHKMLSSSHASLSVNNNKSKEMFYFNLYSSGTFGDSWFYSFVRPSLLKEMQSGKSDPIAVEILGKLYVFAGPQYSDPTFEVYDPDTNTWSALKSPPLLIKSSKYFHGFTDDPLASVVIGNKLCISSRHASFAYDTVEEKWEPFAYQMGRGKVVKQQGLLLVDASTDASWEYLVHLGGGYFCCMYLMNQEKKDHEPNFSVVIFKISKTRRVSRSDKRASFLQGEVLSRRNQRIELERSSIPAFSFPSLFKMDRLMSCQFPVSGLLDNNESPESDKEDVIELLYTRGTTSYSSSVEFLQPLTGMHSGKFQPIAVEIHGKLYVLAGPPYNYDDDYDRFERLLTRCMVGKFSDSRLFQINDMALVDDASLVHLRGGYFCCTYLEKENDDHLEVVTFEVSIKSSGRWS
ncbi:hypothetical protein ACH5RR_030982 [Cinchona calisaya]|uniref:Uncharacterized protein n=1 Tax=Cinchona calisaya TaxID=153742 RepID=A0ABD2YI77_9GENT